MAETNNNTIEYVKTLREQAVRLDNDQYLIKLADAVEQNKGVVSATIELAVASRIQTYNTNQLISEQLSKMNDLITGLIQYQQRCTDLAIGAFGIPEGAVKEEAPSAEPELQLEDPVEEPDVQPQPVQAPVEQTPEPVSEPEPEVKVPDAPKPAKTGKVPDFKVN
tara:strand:+ start:27 stop:521 length:495 start_codon:yes stop_codon:yes gene_type:complete